MPRIAILEPGAPPADLRPRFGDYGEMVARLLGRDFQTERFDVRDGALPGPGAWDGYVITGSAAGVYDPYPWIPTLKAWVQRTAGTAPMIGVCFGHQIMAEAFGGEVIKSPKGWGVGLHTYTLDAAAPWMDSGPAAYALAASHQDQVVTLGDGAEVLGGSEFCPYGFLAYPSRRAISLQPHPEFDPTYAEALIVARREGPLTPDQADEAIASLQKPNDNERVGGWLGRFLREG